MSKDIKTTELKLIDITKIVVSKNNPRQIFDATKLKELSKSIVEHGVLQPILVRVKGQKFELICGERRLKASKIIKLKKIPCQIKKMTDNECLEARLVENLERENVHPLHEAVSFKTLLDKHNYTTQNVADKIAKSVSYVIQRLQLNSLIPNWKKLFLFNDDINISHALIISKLSDADQKIVLEKGKNWGDEFKSAKEMKKFIEENITNSLTNASFDIEDDTLIKEGISCVNCLKRSGSSSLLFSDVEEKDRCFDSPCYVLKTNIHTLKTVTSIVENSEKIILIKAENSEINKGVEKLITDFKVPVLIEYDDFYRTSSDTGKKAFWINGSSVGKFVNIEVHNNKKDKAVEPTTKELIEKIEKRAIRSLELDDEKVHKKIINSFSDVPTFNAIGKLPKTKIDIFLERYIILRSADWNISKELFKTLNLNSFSSVYDNHEEKIKEVLNLSDEQMIYATRQIAFDCFKSHPPKYDTGFFVRKLAEEFKEIPIVDFEKEQKEIADKRIARHKERITKLKAPKKDKTKK